jgi:hypothetical protein
MARLFTGYIDENDCIGDSLGPIGSGSKSTINENSLALDLAVQSLSAYDNSLRAAITPSGSNLAVTNQLTVGSSAITSLTANNIHLTGQVFDSTNNPILRQSGSVLQTYYYEYTDEYVNTLQQTYQTYKSQTIPALGTNSRFKLEANIFGYQVTTVGYRGNVGFEVVTPTSTVRIYGTNGANGNSWQGFYYQGNVHRSAIWTSAVPAGTSLTFRLLVASYDNGSARWNSAGYNSIANFIITEVAS